MKVHLIRKLSLEDFAEKHAQSRIGLYDFLCRLKYADWNTPADISATFPTADLLGNGSHRVVFDIAGNRYRLICKYAFGNRQVHLFVCWLGTHAAYTAVCRAAKQYSINIY